MVKESGKILIIDDDEYITLSLKLFLDQHFIKVVASTNPNEIPALLKEDQFDVVLLDMNFTHGDTSGSDGLFWLEKIKSLSESTNIILITAYGDVNNAVNAMKKGALDFIIKPWQNDKLLATVKTGFKLSSEQQKVKQLKSRVKYISSPIDQQYAEIVGHSAAMQKIFSTISKVARTQANVLILGNNGTGKELVARAIHRNSDRSEEAFISVDLGALSETLFESELFGHKKGAFTDAKADRIGRFEAANKGTIFLDEIGNVPLNLQAKLLTVLQNRQITKLGTNIPIDIDVRIICATNANITELVRGNHFREDLLYRINTVEIHLPSLKDRLDDIPLLVEHFLSVYSKKYNKEGIVVSEHVVKKLQTYDWPGNIRELQHALERALILSDEKELQVADFSFAEEKDSNLPVLDNYNLEKMEEWAVKNAISKHKGNISNAAKELGLSRGAMYRRMEKYGL